MMTIRQDDDPGDDVERRQDLPLGSVPAGGTAGTPSGYRVRGGRLAGMGNGLTLLSMIALLPALFSLSEMR